MQIYLGGVDVPINWRKMSTHNGYLFIELTPLFCFSLFTCNKISAHLTKNKKSEIKQTGLSQGRFSLQRYSRFNSHCQSVITLKPTFTFQPFFLISALLSSLSRSLLGQSHDFWSLEGIFQKYISLCLAEGEFPLVQLSVWYSIFQFFYTDTPRIILFPKVNIPRNQTYQHFIFSLGTLHNQMGVLRYSTMVWFGLVLQQFNHCRLLIPNQFLYIWIVLFQTIQFSIRTQFSSIWSIDRTLSNATTWGQKGPGSDGREGVIRIPQSSSLTETSPSDCLLSSLGHSSGRERSYPYAEKQSVYFTAPADWVTAHSLGKSYPSVEKQSVYFKAPPIDWNIINKCNANN